MTWLKVLVISLAIVFAGAGIADKLDPTIDALCEVTQP